MRAMRSALYVVLHVVMPLTLCGQTAPAASGPQGMMAWDPQNVPGVGWPGATPEASNAAWPTGQQLASLKAWPTQDGAPLPCWKTEVLRDTATGWIGQCTDLSKVVDAATQAACQATCEQNPSCAVWEWRQTNECFQGAGVHCDAAQPGAAPTPVVQAQRIQHGSVRVLKDMRGWEVFNLRPLGYWLTGSAQDAAERCRAFCYSKISCQYWQYGSDGCFVEDPQRELLGLVHKYAAQYPLTTNGGASTSSEFAQTSVGGEYIQHLCPARPALNVTTGEREKDYIEKVKERPSRILPVAGLTSLLLISCAGLCCYVCGCCSAPGKGDENFEEMRPRRSRDSKLQEERPILNADGMSEVSMDSFYAAQSANGTPKSPQKCESLTPSEFSSTTGQVPQLTSPFAPSGGYQPLTAAPPGVPWTPPPSTPGSNAGSFIAVPSASSHRSQGSEAMPGAPLQYGIARPPQAGSSVVLQQQPQATFGIVRR